MSTNEPLTPAQAFARMPQEIDPNKAKDLKAIFQFELEGPQGGTWAVHLNQGACTIENKAVENPNVTIRMTGEDFLALVTGKLQTMSAFISGQIRVYGDYGIAAKLPSLFKS